MNTLESFAVPSQPANTYVNRISNEQTHITFCVVTVCLPRYGICSDASTLADMWVPSIAPTQSYLTNDFNNARYFTKIYTSNILLVITLKKG